MLMPIVFWLNPSNVFKLTQCIFAFPQFMLPHSCLSFQCPLGKYSESSAGDCEKCPLGTYNDDAGANPTKHISCTDCPKGQYQDSTGKSECFDCGIGKFNTRTGRADESSCGTCDPCLEGSTRVNCGGGLGTDGNKHPDSAGFCDKCPKGRYKDTRGLYDTECTQCPEGKVALSTGGNALSKCVNCPTGKVAALDGNECSGCPPGEYAKADTSCGTCQPCVPGKER